MISQVNICHKWKLQNYSMDNITKISLFVVYSNDKILLLIPTALNVLLMKNWTINLYVYRCIIFAVTLTLLPFLFYVCRGESVSRFGHLVYKFDLNKIEYLCLWYCSSILCNTCDFKISLIISLAWCCIVL